MYEADLTEEYVDFNIGDVTGPATLAVEPALRRPDLIEALRESVGC
jgi:hypothetical protein